MNILQICHKPPYPDTDGGTMASYSILRGLRELGHNVSVFALTTPKHPKKEVGDPILNNIDIHYAHVNTQVRPLKALRGLFEKHPYHISRFYKEEAAAKLKLFLEKNTFDLIIFESLFTAVYLPLVRTKTNAPCIYREHNIESALWKQREQKAPLPASLVLKNFNKKLTRFEFDIVNEFDAVACISKSDAQTLASKGLTKPVKYIPFSYSNHAAATETNTPPNPDKIGFIGALNWEPNIEGLSVFIREVWPMVHKKHPKLKFHIAGRGKNTKLEKLSSNRITFEGEVPSAPEFMRSCSVLVVPLYESSGVRVKLIEASALAVPVITTPAGIKGLEMPDDGIAVCESAREFADQISKMIENPHYAQKRGEKAQKYIAEYLNPVQTAQQLIEFVKSL